jgi:hypothetical protein
LLDVLLFLPIRKAEYFLKGGWTQNRGESPSGKSVLLHSLSDLRRMRRRDEDGQEYPADGAPAYGAKRPFMRKQDDRAASSQRSRMDQRHGQPDSAVGGLRQFTTGTPQNGSQGIYPSTRHFLGMGLI